MARERAEEKPAWGALPAAVRAAIGAAAGSPVARGARVWGGYAPTATFRLRLVDGRRAFAKLAGPADSAFVRAALGRERRFYAAPPPGARPFLPRVVALVDAGAWTALVLEDLGPAPVPAWTRPRATAAAAGLAGLHRATAGAARGLPPLAAVLAEPGIAWAGAIATDPTPLAARAGAAAPAAAAWLAAAAPRFAALVAALAAADEGHALLHADLRADNLRVRDGALLLFDWPHAASGPPEFDLATLAVSVAQEGGPPPDATVARYAAGGGRVRPALLAGAAAAFAGHCCDQAWRPAVAALPRLRRDQDRVLRRALPWAARLAGLPPPDWLAACPPRA